MLELLVKSLFGENYHLYRANIMFYDQRKKLLKIHYSFNMLGALDRNFEIDIEKYPTLCASVAVAKQKLTIMEANKVATHRKLVHDGQVWPKMQSVISTPIFNKNNAKVIGLLSMDSEFPLDQSHFEDERIYVVLNAYSDIIKDTVG